MSRPDQLINQSVSQYFKSSLNSKDYCLGH